MRSFKRGFALTLSMLILIFFLTLVLSIESQRVHIEEKTRSAHARMRALVSLFSDMDSPAFDYALSQLAKRSLYDVDMEVINSGGYLAEDTAEDEICASFNSKLKAYLDSLKTRAEDMGLELEYTDPQCSLELIGPYNLSISTSTEINLYSDDISLSKSLNREVSFSIQGIYDPLLAVESSKQCSTLPDPSLCSPVMRPIINSSVSKADLEEVDTVVSGIYGKGWAYGEVVDVSKANDIGENAWFDKILLVNGDELYEWKDELGRFRGVILKGDDNSEYSSYSDTIIAEDGSTCNYNIEVWTEKEPCIYCGKYAIIDPQGCSSVNWGSILDVYDEVGGKVYGYTEQTFNGPLQHGVNIQPSVPFVKIGGGSTSVNSGDMVLVSNMLRDYESTDNFPPTHKDAVLYDIENQRAAVLCANYFAMPGPSIINRLEGKLDANDGQYGLETFAIGEWAKQPYSRIAHEYYTDTSGDKVMGMPGCITMSMCNDPLIVNGERIDEEEMVIGKFRISDDRAGDYGMDDIKVD